MNLYREKKFWNVVLETDFTDDTALTEFFTDNIPLTYLLDVTRFPLDRIILSTIQTELALRTWFMFNEEDLTDVEVKEIIQYIFKSNYLRALAKYPYLLPLINQRATLLTTFGVTSSTTTSTESNTGARVNTSKQNDTPQSGNIDVSSDTYLSSIVKTSTNSAVDTADINQASTNLDNAKLLEFLNKEINSQVEGFRLMILDNCECL